MEEITTKMRTKREIHPNSLANLRPFKKGEIHNPAGRPPKELSLISLIKEQLEQVPKGETKTWAQLIAEAIIKGAYKGKSELMKELMDRIDGKVPQSPLLSMSINPETTVYVIGDEAKRLTEEIIEGKGTE